VTFLRVIADWETYYAPAQKYSLRSAGMDPGQYILDPRFEEIGCAFKILNSAVDRSTVWVDGPDVRRYLQGLGDPRRVMFINHNTLFDACIAAWHHGFVAGCYVDTLGMSRALLGHQLPRHDLDSVARYLGVGTKGTTVHKVANMNRAAIIAAGFYQEYAAYSCGDADLCAGIFERLFPAMPLEEVAIADMVMRMAIQPGLRLDVPVLHEHLAQVRAEKDMLLAQAGLDMSTPEAKEQSIAGLMSNDKFAELLKGMGVDPPTKISITTGEETWAFAKTDEQFKELLEHPDQDVQTLVAARFGHKTTLEESRTERLINVANLNFPGRGTGFLPVPLKVPGAHTLRLSGDWKWNLQNLARPSRRRPRAMLRESIVTPEGYSLVVGDESQVEARGNALFCGQMDLVEEFRRNEDPYCNFGSKVFGRTITKADVGERFMSKTAVLSCGYGVGWLKYQASIRHLSKEQTGTAIILADHEAMRHITMYRTDKYQIAAMWKYLNNVVIPAMTRPDTDFMLGPVRVMFEKIVLPTGLCLHYRQLHKHPQTGDWWFIYGQRIKKLYGGKLLENIIQALCRVIVMQAALRLRKSMAEIGSRAVLQAHDELGYLVPDEHVAQAKALLEVELRRPPVWWPAIPLNCEVGVGKSYGKAK
jgi:hypothetical protein